MLTYAIATLGAFGIITFLGQKNDRRTDFEDFNGIGFKSPLIAFSLSLFMLSLLGLPLTAGFIGKVLVFRPALDAGNVLLTVLVVVAVVNTAISAYYYLRLIVVMFFRERTTEWVSPKIPAAFGAVLLITVLGVLYFGIFGDRIIQKFTQPVVTCQFQPARVAWSPMQFVSEIRARLADQWIPQIYEEKIRPQRTRSFDLPG
jgi:NADH-quinone oxidoreductase subunit N